MEELEAVRAKVDSDIAKWRSKDTGGSDGMANTKLIDVLFKNLPYIGLVGIEFCWSN